MRNLEIFQVQRSKKDCLDVTHIAFNDDITYTLKNSQLHLHNGIKDHVFEETYECITQFEILIIEKVLWFGTGKKFVWVDLDKQLHIIYVDPEFTSAVWNPTQDAISIVFANGEIGVFIVNFNDDSISPIGLSHLINSKPSVVLNVGWGSEETQFRGSAGKHKDSKEVLPMNFNDDLRPRISWRGNGDMYAVNYSNNGQRKFKVFKYPCELLYECTDIIGLQPIIAWKPEGNVIASVTHTNEACEVSLFEKNGFIKNKLELNKEIHVIDLKWSMCGQILSVYQSQGKERFLDLYVTKNYVWYLKQRLSFTVSNPLITFQFKESISTVVLLQVTTTLETIEYAFKFTVHTSSLYENRSIVTCASINGNSVLLTLCEKGMIPPPAFNEKIVFDNPINFVQFHPTEPQFAIIDSRNLIKIYNLTTSATLMKTIQAPNEHEIPLCYHHFFWFSPSQLLCLKENIDGTYKYVIDTNSNSCFYWQDNKDVAVCTKITFLGGIYEDSAHLQQSDSAITLVSVDNHTKFLNKIPTVLHLLAVRIHNDLFTLSLTISQDFYVDGVRALTGVLSFIIHQNYLLLTATENTLICISLDKLKKSETINIFNAPFRRVIEQGGHLLCGIPNSSSVILQMPRGNIETCTVRTISIDRLEYLLNNQAWSDALDLVRLERLNPTILIDLNFNRFIDNVDKFVDSIKTPAVINDFLLGLQEENVFSTVFKDYAPASVNNQNIKGKVEKVCTYVINYMENNNYSHYLHCIIIACFMKNCKLSNYEALGHIRNLLHTIKDNPSTIKIAESAFRSINTLKPQCDMYQNALAMYDLDLALFVARNLQMDPKEYEPFINHLKQLNEIECRFEINDYLKNYENAVKYLVRSSKNNDEIMEYVKRYEVFNVAYNYTKRGSELHKQVGISFAEQLRKQKLYEEAAFVLHSVECYKDAFENYIQAFNITNAILMLNELKLSKEEYHKRLQYLAQVCLAGGKILEAGRIYEMYLCDYHQAIDMYITHNYLLEAQVCAIKFNCLDQYKHSLFEGVLLYCEELHSKLKNIKETYSKYSNRLAIIKSGKLQKLMTFGNDYLPSSINDDTMSIADSLSTITVNTSSSRASTASRRKRKEERKKQDLREGGVYEDIALMRALYELIVEVFSLGPIVRQLCLTAIDVNSNSAISYLSTLHNALLEFQLDIKKCLLEIWPIHLNDNELDSQESLIYENVKSLDLKYREPPPNLDTNWKLSIMSCL